MMEWANDKKNRVTRSKVQIVSLAYYSEGMKPEFGAQKKIEWMSFYVYINLFILFIYFWPRWVFVAARRLSLVAARAGAPLSCGAQASHCGGFSCCGAWALGARTSVVAVHGFSSCGSWALQHRLSSCGARA